MSRGKELLTSHPKIAELWAAASNCKFLPSSSAVFISLKYVCLSDSQRSHCRCMVTDRCMCMNIRSTSIAIMAAGTWYLFPDLHFCASAIISCLLVPEQISWMFSMYNAVLLILQQNWSVLPLLLISNRRFKRILMESLHYSSCLAFASVTDGSWEMF